MLIRPVTYSWLALASVGCLLLILTVRGASDWSGSLAVAFYGLVIGALGLSVVGGLAALLGRALATGQRWFCITVGILVPTLFAIATWLILDFLSHVD